jgi:polysaccharide export outer membrane protein
MKKVSATRLKHWTGAALIWSAASLAVGCSSSDRQVQMFLHDWEATVSASDYRVQPPDVIEISAAQAAEIDGEQQGVRQDGKVTLRLLGEVEVAGLTPGEISRKLESLLRKYYLDPQVNVRVTGANSKHYYVFGQVSRPGAYLCTGRDTLLFVLSQSQPTTLAWKSQVKVIHPSHEPDQRQVLTVDVDKIMEQGKLEQNVLLQEGDILYVPASPLAWVGLRLQELLWPMSPVVTAARTPADVATAGQTSVTERAYRIPE